MEDWKYYALIAAIFISIRDIMSKGLFERMDYVNYIIIANILVFIVTMIYLGVTKHKIKKPNLKDFGIIVLRLFIVFLIVEPSVFYSLRNADNTGYAKSIINLNTLFVFILAVIFLKAEFTYEKLIGIFIILFGGYILLK